MKILVIEDDVQMAKTIEAILKTQGMTVEAYHLGEEGLEVGSLLDYTLIILDLELPDMSGYDVLKKLRKAQIKTPVLILSGLSAPDNKVRGLMEGADDYLTKPFIKEELIARINAIVRRTEGHAATEIKIGDLSINLDKKEVKIKGKPFKTTAKEYDMLELLFLKKGERVTKEQFLSHLYSSLEEEPEMKIIDVFICKLRNKIKEATGGQNYIETSWGQGYALKQPQIKKEKKK